MAEHHFFSKINPEDIDKIEVQKHYKQTYVGHGFPGNQDGYLPEEVGTGELIISLRNGETRRSEDSLQVLYEQERSLQRV